LKLRAVIFLNLVTLIIICSCSSNNNYVEFSANEKLFLVNETEHGLFYSQSTDENVKEMMGTLALSFEANYKRITELFDFTPSKKTIFHVYSDRGEFYRIIGRVTEGTYVAKENIIKVYTPINLENPNVHSEYSFQLVHEFVHAIIQQINPVVGQLKWLDEGTAYYASNQIESELKNRSVYLDIPTLEQLKSPTYFEDSGGSAYFYCGMIVKFITDKYGKGTLNKILRKPEEFESILNNSTENFYQEWKASLQ
jgi:hypothetical protein